MAQAQAAGELQERMAHPTDNKLKDALSFENQFEAEPYDHTHFIDPKIIEDASWFHYSSSIIHILSILSNHFATNIVEFFEDLCQKSMRKS